MKCNSPLSLVEVQQMLYSSFGSSRRNSCPGKISMTRTWLCSLLLLTWRKVLWWAMIKVGVKERIVRLVQAMYNNARSRVTVGSEYSEEFEVGVGVHQGSVLSPLLFIIVLEALSRDFRVGCPGSCSLQMISWSLLLLLRNVLNVSRRGRRDWNPRVFM